MKFIQMIQFFIICMGCYQCMSGILHIPTKKASKTILTYISKEEKKKTKEMYLLELASYFSRYLSISEYKRERLEIQLKIVGSHITPETHITYIFLKVISHFLIAILFLLVPVIGIFLFGVCLLLGINTYFVENSKLDVLIRKKKIAIEKELPRFTNTITQQLHYTRDVIYILENYLKNAEKELAEELKITIADMKSGNYENALTRLETRISSVTLSQVVRGLIGVVRGDNGIFYFEMLSHDLRKLEIQILKTEAIKQPQKIGKYTLFIFLCFLLIIFTSLGVSMGKQMTSIF